MKAAPEISSRKTVTTGSTFQWHRMGHKPCLRVWHIQPARWTQPVTSGENHSCVQVGRESGCSQSQTLIMGVTGELWIFDMFQTLAANWKETEPGPSFSQLGHDHLSQLSKECEHCFPTTKDPELGRKESATHLWISQGNRLCARRGSTAWDHKWRWP